MMRAAGTGTGLSAYNAGICRCEHCRSAFATAAGLPDAPRFRTRRAALYAIGAIAILASANALAHSYAGLYDWAIHHRLSGWQAMSWPAEIDVFLAVGELALYVAYLDGWPARQR